MTTIQTGVRVRSIVKFLDMESTLESTDHVYWSEGRTGTVAPSNAVKHRYIVRFDEGGWAHYEPEYFEVIEAQP